MSVFKGKYKGIYILYLYFPLKTYIFTKKEFNFKQIKACYIKGNTGSSNVLRKLGFEEIGKCEEYFLSRKKTMPCIKLLLKFDTK